MERHQNQAECLRVDDLHFSYDKFEALRGLNFRASTGKITALLGPNGSGKSTTFKILSTQMTAARGDAHIFGHSVTKDRSRVRELIGVTFQAPSLDPWLSVEENLRLHAALYGLSRAEAASRIEELLGLVRLKDRRATRVKALSGGLARRAELAKTLLSNPKLLMLDEPTTGLDPLARFELWQELRKLRDAGMSILVTTHLMEEADLADDILIINKGRLAAHGHPSTLKANLGVDVVLIEGEYLETQEARLRAELGSLARKMALLNGRLRIETTDMAQVFERSRALLGDRVQNIQLGKPTLADVYLTHTGDQL